MSVYREGFYTVELIRNRSVHIFDDAADFGAPTKKGDDLWNWAKQAIEWYGVEGTRKSHKYHTGASVEQIIELMDEWAVSDERKTVKEATERFKISYVTCTTGKCKGFDGFFSVEKVK